MSGQTLQEKVQHTNCTDVCYGERVSVLPIRFKQPCKLASGVGANGWNGDVDASIYPYCLRVEVVSLIWVGGRRHFFVWRGLVTA